MELVGIFYVHLVYVGFLWPFGIFTAIWYILLLHSWYSISNFGMLYQEKSGNPAHMYFARNNRLQTFFNRSIFLIVEK
jgi:hypothetical protein